MVDETITTKQEWYDVKKYKDEVAQYVKKKRQDLEQLSKMEATYRELYKSVYPGAIEADEERFAHTQEMFKVYKASLIESSLSGYSALLEITGEDGPSTLLIPALKKAMTNQFKGMSLLERLSKETVDDWILKGEAVSFIKLKQDKELYRIQSELRDEVTGEKIMEFKVKEAVTYNQIDIERIDPLDFYVDALDYEADPRGCTKIIRTWISAKELLTSDAYPMLTKEDKDAIISAAGKNGGFLDWWGRNLTNTQMTANRTTAKKIEVLTFYGDYITDDNKVLSNIKAVVINDKIADIRYNQVNTNRIIYAAYKVDDMTHRSVSPIASTECINRLANRVTDMFIQNLDDVSNPIMLSQKGSVSKQQYVDAKKTRFLEFNDVAGVPTFWQPPLAAQNGLALVELILNQNKNVLGLNNYLAGDTTGVVRTARESSILFQKANARMRVETDVFSYNYMLKLFNAFYSFNRELALAANMPLDPIYTVENLKVSISTNASRADKEGELQRLLQILGMPIGQMIFSNLTPEQIVLAVRYLMAKAELSDADNLLELNEMQTQEQPQPATPPPSMGPPPGQGEIPPGIMQQMQLPIDQMLPNQNQQM